MLHGESLVYYPDAEFPYYLVVLDVESSAYDFFDSEGQPIYSSEEVSFPEYPIGVKYVSPNEWVVIGATEKELGE